MKKFLVIALLFATPALAQEKPSAKEGCGKTVAECQKKADELIAENARLTAAYQAERQQRINSQTAAGDNVTQTFVQQQLAAQGAAAK